jgi:c-di-GMP-binding flagellar brake protein YcgR
MNFEDLKLLPGTPLQLQFQASNERKKSRLIGYNPNKSILISTPLDGGLPRNTHNGEKLTIRLFSNATNSAIAFTSSIIHIGIIPYHHLHLIPPKSIETDAVRKAARISTRIEAMCEIDGISQKIYIVDLSTAGCRIEADEGFGLNGDNLTLYAKLHVAETVCNLIINGQIKAVIDTDNSDTEKWLYGIDFEDLKDNVRLVLHAYVFSQLNQ